MLSGRPRKASSLASEAKFRKSLSEMGATLLEPEWLGCGKRHHVRDAAGHDCYPRPNNVSAGVGICAVCADRDPGAAEARFRARLAELGAEPMFDRYLGKDGLHEVRCAAGHPCRTRPSQVRPREGRAGGVCAICAKNDPQAAEDGFLARLHEMGATPAYEKWRGVNQPHHVICAAGHDCYPMPTSVQQGRNACRACAGQDPAVAAAEFAGRISAMGGVLHDLEWRGANALYAVSCRAGHECRVRPGQIQQGRGMCARCAGKEWDVFYVVTSADTVKFGITSGDPRARLRVHAAQGLRDVVLLAAGLPENAAHDTERAVLAALALAGEQPVRGREYFPISCTALVLDVARGWLPGTRRLALATGGGQVAHGVPLDRPGLQGDADPGAAHVMGQAGSLGDLIGAA